MVVCLDPLAHRMEAKWRVPPLVSARNDGLESLFERDYLVEGKRSQTNWAYSLGRSDVAPGAPRRPERPLG